jgi:hypothetical protein
MIKMEELSNLQLLERQTLLLDRSAIIQVVSALRGYRELSQKLLSKRYENGECALALCEYQSKIAELEEPKE